jgi:hypothetical protein
MQIDRKTFLLQAAAGGAWILTLGGCGGGGSDNNASTPVPPAAGGCSATIDANHGHELSIPSADLDATTPRTYRIQGSAAHNHDVTFSAAQLAQLKAGQQVVVVSTIAFDHSHTVGERCT